MINKIEQISIDRTIYNEIEGISFEDVLGDKDIAKIRDGRFIRMIEEFFADKFKGGLENIFESSRYLQEYLQSKFIELSSRFFVVKERLKVGKVFSEQNDENIIEKDKKLVDFISKVEFSDIFTDEDTQNGDKYFDDKMQKFLTDNLGDFKKNLREVSDEVSNYFVSRIVELHAIFVGEKTRRKINKLFDSV